MAFTFQNLNSTEIILITPKKYSDQRGFFAELYKYSEFKDNDININIVQINHSKSSKNTLRGLHYQLNPMAQAKIVTVMAGEIFDVGVDIRKGSSTYGKWAGAKLTAENQKTMYIPEGFAHGFCVLSDSAEIIYFCNKEYSSERDRNILWNDPEIKIDWPIKTPILSEKDQMAPLLNICDNNFIYHEKL